MSERITAALEAMRADARIWENASHDLTNPKDATRGLTVEPAQVGMYAQDVGLDQTYEETRAAIEDMLGKAEKYFQKLGTDLKDSAKQYESDDQKAQDEFEAIRQGG